MSRLSVSSCTKLRAGVEEFQARALKKQDGFAPLSASDMESGGIQLDSIRDNQASLSTTASDPATANAAISSARTSVRTKATPKRPKSRVKALATLQSAISTPAVATVALAIDQSSITPLALAPAPKPPSISLSPTTADSTGYDSPPPSPPAHPMFDLPLSPILIRMSLPRDSPAPVEISNERPPVVPMQQLPTSSTPATMPHVEGATLPLTAANKFNISKKRRVPEENAGSMGVGDGNDENDDHQSKKAKRGKETSMTRKSGRARTVTTAMTPTSILTPVLLLSLPPAPSALMTSTSKPEWFIVAVAMLEGEKGLGPTWAKLVKAWAAFKEGAGYQGTRKLSTTRRPDAIKAWIGRARSPTWRPVISDMVTYEAEFMLWWAALQPSWRKSDDGSLIFSKLVGNWEVLWRPGLNGILSVLAGLLFWGVALRNAGSTRKGWNKAVSDCLLVLTSLAAYTMD